jgi:hypothetical protein
MIHFYEYKQRLNLLRQREKKDHMLTILKVMGNYHCMYFYLFNLQ